MIRINKEKLGGAIEKLATTEPENEGPKGDACSCSGSSCGIDKGCKDPKQEST